MFLILCANAFADKPPVLPVEPESLIRALPSPFDDWKVTKSTAEHKYMKWIQTKATRAFMRKNDGATAQVTITDTGRYPSMTAPFRNFEPGTAEGMEKKMIRGNPALIRHIPGRGRQMRMLVDGRFIVELILPKDAIDDGKEWLRSLNLEALKMVKSKRVYQLPKRFTMVKIDQLNPSANRKYDLSITTHAEVEKILKQYEEYKEETAGNADDEEPPKVKGP
jgi:hypothetical protein